MPVFWDRINIIQLGTSRSRRRHFSLNNFISWRLTTVISNQINNVHTVTIFVYQISATRLCDKISKSLNLRIYAAFKRPMIKHARAPCPFYTVYWDDTCLLLYKDKRMPSNSIISQMVWVHTSSLKTHYIIDVCLQLLYVWYLLGLNVYIYLIFVFFWNYQYLLKMISYLLLSS